MSAWGAGHAKAFGRKEQEAMRILANAFGGQSSVSSSAAMSSAGGNQKTQIAWADMTMQQRWDAALSRQKKNKKDEWLCRDCHSTNFMNKTACRGCGCDQGYPLWAAGPPPQKRLPQSVSDIQTSRSSTSTPQALIPVKVDAGDLGAPVAESEWMRLAHPQLKQEEVKLERLRSTLETAGLNTAAQDVTAQLSRLTQHLKGQRQQGQALDQAIAAHRRATQQREKLQAQMASLQRQLTDAHDLEAKMAEEEQTARNNLQTQTPVAMAAPTLPVVIVEQTANRLHQELAAAGTLPSAQQLSTAMIQIMETAWQQMVAATQQALLTGAQQLPQQQQQETRQQEQQALMPEEILRARQQQAQMHNQQQQQQPPLPRTGHLGSGAPTQVDESQMSQSVLQALPAGGNMPAYPTEWGSPSQPMNMDGQ